MCLIACLLRFSFFLPCREDKGGKLRGCRPARQQCLLPWRANNAYCLGAPKMRTTRARQECVLPGRAKNAYYPGAPRMRTAPAHRRCAGAAFTFAFFAAYCLGARTVRQGGSFYISFFFPSSAKAATVTATNPTSMSAKIRSTIQRMAPLSVIP